ncbi:MAG: hypothetical protein DWQ06_11215 [Calditrichaeota bacterium]|nr:MAG: hypothetical protein DWQ06_11215 [Calditrichota bacterium]
MNYIKKHSDLAILEFESSELMEHLLKVCGLQWLIVSKLSDKIALISPNNLEQVQKALNDFGYSLNNFEVK